MIQLPWSILLSGHSLESDGFPSKRAKELHIATPIFAIPIVAV